MFTYTDLNGFGVELSFKKKAFQMEPKHVLVLARYNGLWLLTDHPKRGIEFPGGKVEIGETQEEAAEREVYEETGARITNLEWIATYLVQDHDPFAKAVYVATVESLNPHHPKKETNGAVLMTDEELKANEYLSFHMRDTGMKKILEKVREREN